MVSNISHKLRMMTPYNWPEAESHARGCLLRRAHPYLFCEVDLLGLSEVDHDEIEEELPKHSRITLT